MEYEVIIKNVGLKRENKKMLIVFVVIANPSESSPLRHLALRGNH
jgi:hypothetical protein